MTDIKLDQSWLTHLGHEFDKTYMKDLKAFLITERQSGKQIYPKGDQIFNAFNNTPFGDVRVVILGQDPYHGPGQAHGLCFSVQKDVRIPPSLVNIYKEIKRDLDISSPDHGYLMEWAKQGVLLLNSVLTVERAQAASHQKRGWEQFTDAAIAALNEHHSGLVFLLWGSYAQKKGQFIDRNKHLVLHSPHPSPLSAHRGFLGNSHFSKTNKWLKERGSGIIDWSITP